MNAASLRRRVAFTLATAVLLAAGSHASADWSDDFTGGPTNPPGGNWFWAGFDDQLDPILGYAPVFANDRVEIPSPLVEPGADELDLFIGLVASFDDTYRYDSVRVAGAVGVRDNGSQSNDMNIGVAARGNEFDAYMLNIRNSNVTEGRLELLKSSNADPDNPALLASAVMEGNFPFPRRDPPVTSYSYYLVLDVLETPSGELALTGRAYTEPGGQLVTSIFAVDDGVTHGDIHPAGFSGFYAFRGDASFAVSDVGADDFGHTTITTPLDHTLATPLDGYFDDVSSTTLRPGDANLDTTADRLDVLALLRNYGKSSAAVWDDGDFDGNRAVDLTDVALLHGALANETVALSSAAVPEPSAVVLMLTALATLAAARRCRK